VTGIRLGVNVDHVATIRQARGTTYPDVVEAALAAERGGAGGITVHLREDRRHIQDDDVVRLRAALTTKLNLEMACNDDVVAVACNVEPHDACLVPERREELTTEGGLSVAGNEQRVATVVDRLAAAGVRVSLFIDPDEREIEATLAVGAPAIELHTGAFADAANAAARTAELERLRRAAAVAYDRGLQVNAGHGLTVANVGPIAAMPQIVELNIGHSIVARALIIGIEEATREMLEACVAARRSA
jgi:pyridoxine 5-phosphate synthase